MLPDSVQNTLDLKQIYFTTLKVNSQSCKSEKKYNILHTGYSKNEPQGLQLEVHFYKGFFSPFVLGNFAEKAFWR